MKTKRRALRRGFSLIELLVAMAVFSLLSVLLFSTIDAMLRASGAGSADVERAEKAGLITSRLSQDVQSALLPIVPSDQSSLQLLSSPSTSFDHPHSLFFQAPVNNLAAETDIAIVGYCIRWDTTTPNNPRAILCRVTEPLSDPTTLQFPWATDDLVERTASASDQTDPPYQGLLATDVIALWIRTEDLAGNSSYTFDSRVNQSLPAAVEIAFVILDQNAAAKLTKIPEYSAQSPSNLDREVQDFIEDLEPGVRTGARIFKFRVTPAAFRIAP